MQVIDKVSKAFISYATEDRAIADAVASDLRARHVEVWIDREGLVAGSPDWEALIREAVAESFGVVLIATPTSRSSQFVQSELLLAEASGLPVYPLWAAGDKWIDAIPLGLSRTQYQDIRGSAYTAGVTRLADVFTQEGRTLPPHFVYRAFTEMLADGTRRPRGTMECGWAGGKTVYQKIVPDHYMVVEYDWWFRTRTSHPSQTIFDAILIRPSAYRMAAHLLDTLYLNYFADRFAAFTYGSTWVLSTGDSGDGVLALDPRSLQQPKEGMAGLDVLRRMTEAPERYNLSPGERFFVSEYTREPKIIVAAWDPWITKKLIRNPKGRRGVIREVLTPTPARQLNIADYPYVAVVSSFFLPDIEPDLAWVQSRECPEELKSRFDY